MASIRLEGVQKVSREGAEHVAWPRATRDIAMVFQSYALYPHMSVRDNLGFALKLRKTRRPHVERRVRGSAATPGTEPLIDRKPRRLSGGRRRRVALG